MSRSELVESRLGDEEVVATVSLAGDDMLVVTPTRSLLYRAEGLISDESVEEFPHDASRLTIDEGRRKAKIRFEYPIQDPRTMSVPPEVLNSVLHYVVAGVLNVRGVTDDGEVVRRVFRFNELTLVITDRQLVTHIGTVLWDDEFDQFRYEDLTGLEFEEGSIATQVALYIDDRSQRIKVPPDRAAELEQELTGALVSYYEVDDPAELDDALGVEEEDEALDAEAARTGLNLSGDIEPIEPGGASADGPAEVEWPTVEDDESPDPSTDGAAEPDRTPDEPDIDPDELRTVIRELESTIEQQQELLAAQADAVAALADALERDT